MKRKTFATLLVLGFLTVLMIWSFGSSAANHSTSNLPAPVENLARDQVLADEDQDEVDADLGKHASRIDREEYLRARDEYIARKRGIEPGMPFNPELRSEAIDQMERQEKGRRLESLVMGGQAPPLAIGGAWTPIGPTTIANGQSLSGGNTAVSGRVTSVVVDPNSSNKVYLGTAQGGVWRSLDGGVTWTAIFDSATSLAIGALALAPSNTSILYVGTGEFNGCADCFFGAGLYRIDNVDTAPSLVGPINPQQTIGNLTYNVFNGRSITKILVHPTDVNTIWVSTARGVGGSGANALGQVPALATRGVYRSTNAAATNPTFQKLVVTRGSSSADSPGTSNLDIADMAMEPGTPDNILVAVIGAVVNGVPDTGGIYRTTNATAATPTFTNRYAAAAGVRISLAINKVGSTVTAYAATSETPTNTTGCNVPNTGALR